jgi:hypothetical protein
VPPRFAYWTILIDDTPTAFRARDREELLPTLTQLKRTNQNIELRWFAQGRLWDSPEQQRESWRKAKEPRERRGRDWRPGGQHKDPRARFTKEQRQRDRPPRREGPPRREAKPGAKQGFRPGPNRRWHAKPPHARNPPAHQPVGARRRRRRDDEPPDRD